MALMEGDRPAGRRRLTRVMVSALFGIGSLGAAAGGFAADQAAGAASPTTTLVNAVVTTAAATTGRFSFDSQTVVSGTHDATFDLSGNGSYDLTTGSADLSITTPAWSGGTTTSHLVVSGGSVYLHNPTLSAFVGKPWVSTTFSAIGSYIASKAQGASLPAACGPVIAVLGSGAAGDLPSTAMTLPPIQPDTVLDALSSVSSGVKNFGTETVGGISTTHLHATIDLAKALGSHPGGQCALDLLDQYTSLRAVPVDVWVDPSGLIRQASVTDLAFSVTTPKGNLNIGETAKFDLSDFGSTVSITVPPASLTDSFASIPSF